MRVRQEVTSSETGGQPSIRDVTLSPPPSMATCECDDGFGLFDDVALPPPETQPDPSPPPPPPQGFYLPQKQSLSSTCFADDAAASSFSPAARDETQASDRKKHHQEAKRRDRAEEESGDGGEYCSYFSNGGRQSSKKGRGGGGSSASAPAGVEYRKDREEWSDEAIGCLLEAYTKRFEQLQRRNLRGRDWKDVADAVTKQQQHKAATAGKSVEQCKNKIDNLKKRYKVEFLRIAGGSSGTSSEWPWFKKLEFIVGNPTLFISSNPRSASNHDDDDKSWHHQQQKNKSYIPSGAGLLSTCVGSRFTSFSNPKWKRALLKIGGSELAGGTSENVDPKVIMLIAREVQVAKRHGVQVAIVVGSRNIYCADTWTATTGIDRTTTCPIGMMASVMNAMLLQASLQNLGVETRVQTALMTQDVVEPYIRQRAIHHLEKGRVVIFGGIGSSMGNPLFTTDTAAALRASEINADVVLKGTAGDSVYGCLPGSNSSANAAFEHISYRELVARGSSTIDVTAITFCEENHVPVVIFNMLEPGNISRALCGEQVGTLVDQSGRIG